MVAGDECQQGKPGVDNMDCQWRDAMTDDVKWRGSSASERRSERRERLIAAALAVYGEIGFRDAGVRAICRAAGLTERYFYESFANGEELLAAVFTQQIDLLIRAVRVADPGPAFDAETRARAQLTTYYGAIREHPGATRLFVVELPAVGPTMDALFTQALWRLSDLMFETHDPGRSGPFAVNPLLLRGVAGGLLHIAIGWLEGGLELPLAQVVGAALPLVLLARLP